MSDDWLRQVMSDYVALGEAGNHIITFAKGKIITLAKQAHNSKLFSAVLFTFCENYDIIQLTDELEAKRRNCS